jgi:hypothetical protein
MNPSQGTYTFTLLNGEPPVSVGVDIDSALSLGTWFDQNGNVTTASNNVYTAVIEPSGNNPFRITASGDDENAGAAKISVQNNTIGVGGDDTLQQQDADVFNLSFVNTTGQQTTLNECRDDAAALQRSARKLRHYDHRYRHEWKSADRPLSRK